TAVRRRRCWPQVPEVRPRLLLAGGLRAGFTAQGPPGDLLASFPFPDTGSPYDRVHRLDRDEPFRKRFREVLWPRLMRVIDRNDQALELYLDEPHLWELLGLIEGEELLARHGLLPVPLLFGPEAYPKDFHEHVTRALLAGNGTTFEALTAGKFRKEPLFRKLLQRHLPGPVLSAALNKLQDAGSSYSSLLRKFDEWDDEVLAE